MPTQAEKADAFRGPGAEMPEPGAVAFAKEAVPPGRSVPISG